MRFERLLIEYIVRKVKLIRSSLQLGRNPPVASVSLGAVRVFEFRKKNGPPNFIRFPLFPGSLLVMEGATQEDWLHCLPRDTNCKEERINLTFRTMYSINKRSNRI
jgi:hypothetical protein